MTTPLLHEDFAMKKSLQVSQPLSPTEEGYSKKDVFGFAKVKYLPPTYYDIKVVRSEA